MDENSIILTLHELFEQWQTHKPSKTNYEIYEELAEMLSIVAEEQGAFDDDDDDEQ